MWAMAVMAFGAPRRARNRRNLAFLLAPLVHRLVLLVDLAASGPVAIGL
jgi:hypothetical protein